MLLHKNNFRGSLGYFQMFSGMHERSRAHIIFSLAVALELISYSLAVALSISLFLFNFPSPIVQHYSTNLS